MPDLIIVAHVKAKPGHEAALVAAQVDLVGVVRSLPGCIAYELHEAEGTPGEVVFYERWRDRAAWEAHMAGPHMDAFRANAGPMIGVFELFQMRQVA
ncbi:hypothetical protein PMI14_07099 [Acidovorax sp. CF316]|uniref:putative quinol monooxygenase n=1 Tax=Acidovorax sp. CF316 TaxID=1144317 RepID=UPI00026BC444|nr:putative quinol monooxygenase [Acidovorax sp. CF316]EJE48463.1 hypothetical protein PMI14_07099 [Acidovorax sp. CF316]